MQISVRSYLIAGTAAVVGAGAIAMTPVAPAVAPTAVVPMPTVAEVNLAAFSLNDVVGLLDTFGIGGALPGILTSLPSLLPADIVTAVVNEFLNQAGPLVTTAAGEVFGFLGTTLTGLIAGPNSIPVRFGEALAAIPTVLVTAIGSLSTGDIPTALQTLADGLAAPIAGITQAFAEAQLALQDFVTDEFNGLVAVLPGVLFNAVQTVIGGSLQALVDSIGGALSGLIGGLFPAPGASLALAAAAPAALSVAAPAAAATVPDLGASARSVTVSAPEGDVPATASGPAAVAESAEVAVDVVVAPAPQVDLTEVVAPIPRPRPSQVRPVADAPAPSVTADVSVDAEAAAPAPAAGKSAAANGAKGRAAQPTRAAAE